MKQLQTSHSSKFNNEFDDYTMKPAKSSKNKKYQTTSNKADIQKFMPDAEEVAKELGTAKSMDDFWGKKGIFSRLFANTMENMMQAELTEHLGYDKYSSLGKNTGNSRNGNYSKKVRTSGGDEVIEIPRDRNGNFEPRLLKKYETSSNEIEDKITAMYAKGMTVRDIQDMVGDIYGINVSPTTISTITDKVIPLVEDWQNRPLDKIYPVMYLDCIHVKMRREGKIDNTAVYIAFGLNMEGKRDVLGHWVGVGGEGANFWLTVVTELQARGVEDIFIACIDGLKGFNEAIQSVFPKTAIQRCIIHQIRSSLKYVSWKDRKEFIADLKLIYKAKTKEAGETNLIKLSEKWGKKYTMAVRSWENNWDELSTFFDYTPAIRRIIYTTNTIEGYNRQIRKIIKNRSMFPSEKSVRKLLYLANCDIVKKWTMPMPHWPDILNQLAIKFEERFEL